MKKITALLLALAMMLSLCACGSGNEPVAAESQGITASLTEVEPTPKPTTEPVQETIEEPTVPTEETAPIEWTNIVYYKEDTDGYQYEITIKLSPWILLSNTQALSSAWNEVSQGTELPSYESWGVNENTRYPQIKGNSFITGSDGFITACSHGITDMYYSVGSLEVKNVTDGWSIDSSQPRSLTISAGLWPCRNDYKMSDYAALVAGKTFAGDRIDNYVGGIRINPLMSGDNWGPVPFVLMASEVFSPNAPNGGYYDYILNDLIFASSTQSMFSEHFASEFPYVRQGIIGKDGVYSPPTRDIPD